MRGERPYVDDHYWTQMYRIWNSDSGAERLTRHVLAELLPKLYPCDRSYRMLCYGRPSRLDIWGAWCALTPCSAAEKI